MTITRTTVDLLKAEGKHFTAGALAHELGMPRDSYGCHFSMRSDLMRARTTYQLGWDAAEKEA